MSGEATPDPLLSGIGLPHDIFSQDVNDDAGMISGWTGILAYINHCPKKR